MKLILILGLALALMACEPETKDIKQNYIVPEELSDCTFTLMKNTDGESMRVVRCPNSTISTSYNVGKTRQTTVVIDGVEYIKKETSK